MASMQPMVSRYTLRGHVDRRVSPQTFRHTYATDMLSAGLTIRGVQRLLGHSHVNTTMICTPVNDDAIAAKVAAL